MLLVEVIATLSLNLLAFGGCCIEILGVAASIAVLGVVQGAYATEVFRGAILAVPSGQIEAAKAMGMPGALLARRISLPLMLALV